MDAVIIGMGGIAVGYDEGLEAGRITHIDALNEHPRFRIKAALETDERRRRELSEWLQFPIYDESELSCIHSADLVVICTPTHAHLNSVQLALTLNPRYIILEKPISDNCRSSEKIADLSKSNNVFIHVNLFRLFDRKLSDVFSSFSNFEMNAWCSKGLLHNGIHFLSLYLHHFNGDVRVVSKREDYLELETNKSRFTLKNVPGEIDDNGFVIRDGTQSFYYIDGGRIAFYNINNNKQYLGSYIKNYMDYIYEYLSSDMVDSIPSLDIALECQRLLGDK